MKKPNYTEFLGKYDDAEKAEKLYNNHIEKYAYHLESELTESTELLKTMEEDYLVKIKIRDKEIDELKKERNHLFKQYHILLKDLEKIVDKSQDLQTLKRENDIMRNIFQVPEDEGVQKVIDQLKELQTLKDWLKDSMIVFADGEGEFKHWRVYKGVNAGNNANDEGGYNNKKILIKLKELIK